MLKKVPVVLDAGLTVVHAVLTVTGPSKFRMSD